MKIKTSSVEIIVPGSTPMATFVAKPEGQKNLPGLLVLQEAFGVNHHIKDVAERFAREGYFCVAPELFHRTAPPGFAGAYDDFPAVMPHLKALSQETLALDLKATFDWLTSQEVVEKNKIGAIGYCMGGWAAFIANGTLKLQTAVSYYGGGIADALALAPTQNGPLLLVWGGADAHIGLEKPRRISDALQKEKKNFIDVVFSEADHGFFCDERKSYHAQAAKVVWPLTLEFLSQSLK